ncbi:hypothetical protein ABEB36_013730 [Hypothenemus hampei]|uniref:Suppressor of white apricot N-terminal domain-containing protein n=1 Tax=Hypothenemus hampei TaxID=57062 RepID=A0ABD1E544_HYPHA
MWHEARRQERKIRGMLVDYRKRAERRRDFYEKIKADPTQFLQIHGRQCKIHLDPAIAAAADSAVMMPWQGNENNLIDRFDVRAHLDIIPPVKKEETLEGTPEERHLNYERYRIIAQNAYLGISEEKFLKQLHLEEQFGYTESKSKKDSKGSGVAIGFNYEEGTAITAPIQNTQSEDEEDNSDSDLDVDLAINVSKIDSSQAHEMNKHGQQFGMAGNDFYSYLTNDMEEAESYKLAREEEHEKALYSGRKSRRERRAHREKRLANRKISPPSYAAKESPTHPLKEESRSRSRSISPEAEKITYITSFGDDEEPANNKPSYADMVKYGKPRASSSNSNRKYTDSASLNISTRYSENRYKRSRSRSRQIRSRSRSRKRSSRYLTSRSRSPRLKRVKSQSRSPRSSLPRKNSRSRSTSRGRSRNYQHSRSRSLVKSCRKRSSSSKSRSRSSSSSLSSSSSSSRSSSRNRSFYRRRTSSTSSSLSSDSIPRRKSISKSPPRKSKSPEAPAPPRIRYYGRKKSDVSTSESSTDSDDNNDNNIDKKSVYTGTRDLSNRFGNNSGSVSKVSKNYKSNSTIYNCPNYYLDLQLRIAKKIIYFCKKDIHFHKHFLFSNFRNPLLLRQL